MAENKTKATPVPAAAYMATVEPPIRREEAATVDALMARISGAPATMWGPSIIGYGTHHYVYESGREGDMPRIAFSPRKPQLVFYIGASNADVAALLPSLGKHSTGKGCLYVKKLTDIDMGVLERIVQAAWDRRG